MPPGSSLAIHAIPSLAAKVGPISEFLYARYTFVDEPPAKFYGMAE